MSTFAKQNGSNRGRRTKTLALAAVVLSALANNFHGLSATAAVRLPEEAVSLEPYLFPSNDIPAVVDTAPIQQFAPPADAPRRTASTGPAKATPDRPRRQSSRRERRALAELMDLVVSSGESQPVIPAFERFKSCREFVAINC